MHKGIDVANNVGTPIVAAQSGRVTFAGWHDGGYGYLVEITHEDGSMSRYAHNSALMVREGDLVQQGQQISQMGSTGRSTGPHLHFEIHPPSGGAINPLQMLPPKA
jgi:murein DD-endopeptidase MepM/ murein hydrolase activator NlpD